MSNSQILSEIFRNELRDFRTIGILGFGREGSSTFKILKKYFSDRAIVLADQNATAFDGLEDISLTGVKLLSGEDYLNVLNICDIVFTAPGVPLFGIHLPETLVITSQTDIVFRMFGKKIIAVTGTKGKSTTSSLIAHMLRKHYVNIPLAGNIGIPPFEVLEQLIDAEYAVFEVSSHQLQYVSSAPGIAILLNLFPEHLDYYPDEQTYYNAKLNLCRYQTSQDIIVLNNDAPKVFEAGKHSKAFLMHYSTHNHGLQGAFVKDQKLVLRVDEEVEIVEIESISLKGKHNISNCLAAICACHAAGIPIQALKEGLTTFRGLPHRMERIVSVSGKVFYNDSIATIPEATLAAIEALNPVSTLILGGNDRGLNYDEFLEQLSTKPLKNICFYGDAGARMIALFRPKNKDKNIRYDKGFSECVVHAVAVTNIGELCLLSPAASSYDQFRNFEERGEFFRNLVSNC